MIERRQVGARVRCLSFEVAAGVLAAQHQYHTATLLSDERVLVAGGAPFNSASIVNAEIYDPATTTWRTAPSIDASQPRLWWATATALPGGAVLVAGGGDAIDWVLDEVNVYDPAADAWTHGAPLASVRIFHSATLLPDGKVLLVGGFDYGDVLASTEIYDPRSGQSIRANDLVQGRALHTSTLLPSGAVLVTGGADEDFIARASCEIFLAAPRRGRPLQAIVGDR